MKQECKVGCSPCSFVERHQQVRPLKGDKGRADRGSIYPDGLCRALVLAGAPLYGKVYSYMHPSIYLPIHVPIHVSVWRSSHLAI